MSFLQDHQIQPHPSPTPPRHDRISHRLSLRLFLRWGLDWPLCGEDTSFFRSLVGEGGPVPLPILVGRKNQRLTPGLPQNPSCPAGTSPKATLGRARKPQVGLCPICGSSQTCCPGSKAVRAAVLQQGCTIPASPRNSVDTEAYY